MTIADTAPTPVVDQQPTTRGYHTFWEWFTAQRCRDDDVGQFARDVWRDPNRCDRNFTAQSLAEYLVAEQVSLDTWVKAREQYAASRTPLREAVWQVQRTTLTGASWSVGFCDSPDDADRLAALFHLQDPQVRYTVNAIRRVTYRCRLGDHEWWEEVSALRCCDPLRWDRISVFPDRPLPEDHDRDLGIVTDPAGWRWVWVPK